MTPVTLREIAAQCRLFDDADALMAWLLERVDDVAAAFGVPVAKLGDGLERAYTDGQLAKRVAGTCKTLAGRERDAKRSAAGASMQAAVDASVTAGAIDARALLAAVTAAPLGSVLVAGVHRVPLAKLRELAACRRVRGAAAVTCVVTDDGLRFEWRQANGDRGRVCLHTERTPAKDKRGRVTGYDSVYDEDALVLVLPA